MKNRDGVQTVCLSCDFEAVWSPRDRARHLHDVETDHEVAYESAHDQEVRTDGGRHEIETTSSMWYCPQCKTWVGRKLSECVSAGHSRPRYPVLYENVAAEDARDVTLWDQLKAVIRGVIR